MEGDTHSELPFISVIVPVYNGERSIGDCVKSILAVDYPKDRFDVIVVDNGSTDRTADIVKALGITCLNETGISTSYAARNRGISASKGAILAFTDADCVVSKRWLAEAGRSFAKDLSVGCIAGEIAPATPQTWVDEILASKQHMSPVYMFKKSTPPYAQTANAFYRRTILDQIGFFEERWVSAGDADLCWRMQLKTPFTLKYSPWAKVCHKHRSTLAGIFRQQKRWAYGALLLASRYPFAKKSRFAPHAKTIYRSLKMLVMQEMKALLMRQKNTERRGKILYMVRSAGSLAGSISYEFDKALGRVNAKRFKD